MSAETTTIRRLTIRDECDYSAEFTEDGGGLNLTAERSPVYITDEDRASLVQFLSGPPETVGRPERKSQATVTDPDRLDAFRFAYIDKHGDKLTVTALSADGGLVYFQVEDSVQVEVPVSVVAGLVSALRNAGALL